MLLFLASRAFEIEIYSALTSYFGSSMAALLKAEKCVQHHDKPCYYKREGLKRTLPLLFVCRLHSGATTIGFG